ncbi:hypothetical protein MBLNU13_g03851t1 [Cladosporium sp. NU13]
MPTESAPLTFLTLPPEIRNQVYSYIFIPPVNEPIPRAPEIASPLAIALQLDSPPCTPFRDPDDDPPLPPHQPTSLSTLLTCHQIHREAQLLAISTTTFHLHSTSAEPEHFTLRALPLSPAKLGAIKHLTLTARITQLRALNETWNGHPFGNSSLHLDTLTLVPRRPDATKSAWAEVAELDQCHTLAHVLAETFKTLGKVGEVKVVWRWGGMNCGVRFECSAADDGNGGWFKAFLGQVESEGVRGSDAGDEAYRLLTAEGTSPGAVAAMP